MRSVAYACAMSPGGSHPALEPSPWVVRFAHLVPREARVLDLACGHGRHARFFAERGARVLAVDRDADALSSLAGIRGVEVRVADLEAGDWPLGDERFDAIVVTNYLHRPLFAAAGREGVLYVPGEYCYPAAGEPVPRNSLRLSFGVQSCAKIQEGVEKLARAIEAYQEAADYLPEHPAIRL